MTTTDLASTVLILLDSLGDTADKVADNLRARNIKGVQKSECGCPIARLLLKDPGIAQVEVGAFYLTIYPSGDDGIVEIEVPRAVSDFIWYFDRGVFRDLVEITPAVAA